MASGSVTGSGCTQTLPHHTGKQNVQNAALPPHSHNHCKEGTQVTLVREVTRKSRALLCVFWCNSPTWAKAKSLLRNRDRSARPRDLYLTTHNIHTRQTNAAGGIRTHNTCKRAAANPRLRPGGTISNQCNHGNYRNTDNVFTKVPVVTLLPYIKGKVHPCTGTEALYRPYGP